MNMNMNMQIIFQVTYITDGLWIFKYFIFLPQKIQGHGVVLTCEVDNIIAVFLFRDFKSWL